LSELGAAAEISMLLRELKCERRKYSLRWYLRDARRTEAERKWTPPRSEEISRWLIQEDAVLVKTEDDLRLAVLVSLERFRDRISKEGRFVLDCWERQASGAYRPIFEEDLSSRVADFLREDLRKVVISTEEQLRLGVVKQRTDVRITLEADGKLLSVIIEHKRAHNPEVAEGMKDQLADRYLIPSGNTSGIYWVSWFDGFEKADSVVKNCLGVETPDKAFEVLSRQAAKISESMKLNISAFVLDCSKGRL